MKKENPNDTVLSVVNLKTYFDTPAGVVKAVDGISFDVKRDNILAIVGESGSGKSVTALSTMRLLQVPPGRYVGGSVLLNGRNVLDMSRNDLDKVRGKEISMIFQNPRNSLNPAFLIIDQIIETLRTHDKSMSQQEAKEKALASLREVGIPKAEQVGYSYPHQLSTGMCQRVALSLSLSCNPKILIADEPTTMLDTEVQAKILLRLKQIHKEYSLPIILITHDFGVVKAISKEIIVMYAGKIQEQGAANMILSNPQHPYTKALINSVPDPNKDEERLYQIPGQPPDLSNLPKGCSFASRCPSAMEICYKEIPDMYETSSGSKARCHLFVKNNIKEGL